MKFSQKTAVYLAVFCFPLPLIFLFNQAITGNFLNFIYYDAGITAYCWWLSATFLSTRPNWLVQRMSMPSLYFLHGILGVGSLALAFLHRHNLITMGQLIHLTGDWAWYLSLGSMIYAVIFLSGWLVDRFRIIAKLKRFLEHVFKHQITIWLHRLNLIAIILIWLHVI